MTNVSFLDLKTQYKNIKQEIDKAVLMSLDSAAYVLGPEVEQFEREFASLHHTNFGVAVNSGTSALHLSLLAAGVGPGDEVITSPMTFTATAAAISYTGATPVFCDINKKTLLISPESINEKLSSSTKAIIPVHLHGQSAEMDTISDIAEANNLYLVEDCAQAHLATFKGKPVGGFGDFGCFSFYPGKNLGAYGEGGLITTNCEEKAEKLRLLRDWGQRRKYHHEILAYNARMDGIQGAILRVKLRYLKDWTEARRSLASIYLEKLPQYGLTCTYEAPERYHVFHIFSIFHNEREKLQKYLQSSGIATSFHYPVPVHLQTAYKHLGYKQGDFPIAEKIASTQLSLPLYPELTEDNVNYVCEVLSSFEN